MNDSRSPVSGRVVWWLMLLPMVASAAIRDLWAPDEPRYAQVAREIYSGGSFLVMHLCGQPYPDKPPLLFWLAGLGGWLGGWHELWLRLPSLVAAAGTAWLIAVLARRWWGPREAAWAPALFLGMALVTEIGGRLQIDPLLTLLCTLAIVLVSRPGAAFDRGRDLALAGVAAGLAALAKGPVAWLNIAVPLVSWRLLVPGAIPRARRRDWIVAALLAIAPVLLWAGAASLAEPSMGRELFFSQHAGRVTDVGERHPGPPWKHLERMPLLLLPWTFLVALGLAGAVRALRQSRRGEEGDHGLLLALAWVVPLFLFYSAIPPKRDLYLLPIYPAAALLAARPLAGAMERGRLPRWVSVPTAAVLAILGLGLTLSGFFTDALPGLPWRGPVVGAPLLAGGLAALVWSRRADARGWAASVLAGWCAFGVLMALVVFPPLDPLKSARGLALEIAARPERPRDIPCVGVQPEGYRFYAGVPTVRARSLEPALERDGADFLALVLDDVWKRMDPTVKSRCRVLIDRRVGGKRALLLGAAPVATGSPSG